MKNVLLFIFILLACSIRSKAQDLPGPPANSINMLQGAVIIPMDNTNQQSASGLFNLKAYGLVVHLINNGFKVKWVIKAGKAKDGIDFTVTTNKLRPTVVNDGLSRNFRCGPFVIFRTDTTGISYYINSYYTSKGLTGNDRPSVYVTTANVFVDVRYNNLPSPKGAILTDGGNELIHWRYMLEAGIPAKNFTTSAGDNLTSCFSFASEPHNTATGPLVDTAIKKIRQFVLWGGNFLAQCAAVSNYENNPLGRFHTTTGITVPNSNIGSTLTYLNSDLSFSQYEGAYFGYDGASVVQNWRISGAGINNEHNHATGTAASGYGSYLVAAVSKVKTGLGGLVFYIGCHDYLAVALQPLTINGLRMYMNAFLTPAAYACPLPMDLVSFAGRMNNGRPHLEWIIGQNETGSEFEVEKSFDGAHFSVISRIPVTSKEGMETYSYNDATSINGRVYYRIKLINLTGKTSYSKIIALGDKEATPGNLTILENPVGETLGFNYTAGKTDEFALNIYNMNGAKVYSSKVKLTKGANILSHDLGVKIASGVYVLEISSNQERASARLIKK